MPASLRTLIVAVMGAIALLAVTASPSAAAPGDNTRASTAVITTAPTSIAGNLRSSTTTRTGATLAGSGVQDRPQARAAGLLGTAGKVACGLVCLGFDLAKRGGRAALDAAGDVASEVAGNAVDLLAQKVADGGAWMLRRTARAINRTTTPVLTQRWFVERYREMQRVGLLVAVFAFLAAVIAAITAQDGAAMAKMVFIRLPVAFLVTGGIVVVAQLGVEISDNVAADFGAQFATDMSRVLRQGAKGLTGLTAAATAAGGPAGAAIPAIVTIFVGIFAIVTAFVLWLELLIRDAGIYTVVYMLPLVFGAMIWERLQQWASRALMMLLALIWMKPLIVAIMSLASGGLAEGIPEQGLELVLVVVVLMFLACLTPGLLLMLIPLFDSMQAHGAAKRAASGPASAATGVGGQLAMSHLMREHFGGGGKSGPAASERAVGGAAAGAESGAAAAGGAAGAAAGGVGAAAAGGQALKRRVEGTAARQANAAGDAGGRAGGDVGGDAGGEVGGGVGGSATGAAEEGREQGGGEAAGTATASSAASGERSAAGGETAGSETPVPGQTGTDAGGGAPSSEAAAPAPSADTVSAPPPSASGTGDGDAGASSPSGSSATTANGVDGTEASGASGNSTASSTRAAGGELTDQSTGPVPSATEGVGAAGAPSTPSPAAGGRRDAPTQPPAAGGGELTADPSPRIDVRAADEEQQR